MELLIKFKTGELDVEAIKYIQKALKNKKYCLVIGDDEKAIEFEYYSVNKYPYSDDREIEFIVKE